MSLKRTKEYGNTFINEWRCNPLNKLPNESFYFKEGKKYLAVNKTAGDLHMEEFSNKEAVEEYLNNSFYNEAKTVYTESIEVPAVKLNEWVTLQDLQAPAATSDFTKNKRKQRQQLYGTENKLARLVNAEYDPEKDAMTFMFVTTPTYKAHEVGYIPLKTDPNADFAKKENPEKLYTMLVRVLNFNQLLKDTRPDGWGTKPITWRELYEVLQVAYVQVHCNCPAHWWQGSAYWLTQLDGAVYPCNIAPKKWNADDKHGDSGNFACKHLAALLSQIGFFRVQMASMAQRVLKAGGYIKAVADKY